MKLEKLKLNQLAPVLLIIAAFIWGSSIVVTKDILVSIPTFWVLTIRFGGATILLSIILHKKLKLLDKDYFNRGGLMGFFLFLSYSCQILGLNYTTPSKNAFLIVIYCIIVPILYWIVDKKRPDRYNILAALLCISGIGFVSLTGGIRLNIGDILTLVGGLFFACSIVATAKYVADKDLFLLTIVQFFVFSSLSLIIALTTSPFSVKMLSNAGFELIYLIVFGSCVTFIFQNIGQKYTPPTTAAILISLEAPFAVMLSVVTGVEILTPIMVFGFSLIFLAIVCSETKFSFLTKKKVILENELLKQQGFGPKN